jgi:hypothetical protein
LEQALTRGCCSGARTVERSVPVLIPVNFCSGFRTNLLRWGSFLG